MISSKSFHFLLVHYYKTNSCKYSCSCWNYLHHAVMSTTCTHYFYSIVEALKYYSFSFYFTVLYDCCIFVNTLLSFIWFVSLFSQNLISGIPRIGQGQRKSLHMHPRIGVLTDPSPVTNGAVTRISDPSVLVWMFLSKFI